MRVTVIERKALLLIICCASVLFSWRLIAQNSVLNVVAMPASRKIVMIDPGHGGEDPGAIVGKTYEKNINIAIAQKLQTYLEQGDAYVLMTRVDDKALAMNKQSDMYKRKIIANASGADIFVSIHQNYYRYSGVNGAQVFYFGKSERSKQLAECIQAEVKQFAQPSNRHKVSPNTDYYVLRQTTMPSVLVECGYISNYGDRSRLSSEEYQEKMAWAIYMGILKYFENEPGL